MANLSDTDTPPSTKTKRSSGYGPNKTVAAMAKKQSIKQVAARLFAERGVAAVGLASVGMVAGLPNRGVSYYYRNREDLLVDILVDHVLMLTERVGAAYDANETADPVTRLHILVLTLHQAVLEARDAHRAMLFNTALLPPQSQSAVRGRYRVLLEMFVETLCAAVPELVRRDAVSFALPALDRLLSGVVFWAEPSPAPPVDPADMARYARMVTQMVLGTARGLAAEPVAGADASAEAPEWLAPLRPEFAPRTAWSNFSAARDDMAVDSAEPVSAGLDAAAKRARLTAELGDANELSAREALRRWYEVLPVVASGVTYVITSRGWRVARLGPVTGAASLLAHETLGAEELPKVTGERTAVGE